MDKISKICLLEVKTVIATSVYAHVDRYVTDLEAIYENRDMQRQYEHLKRLVGLSGKQAGVQQFIKEVKACYSGTTKTSSNVGRNSSGPSSAPSPKL